MISFTTGLDVIGIEIGITYVISHDYAKIKLCSFYSLPRDKSNFS